MPVDELHEGGFSRAGLSADPEEWLLILEPLQESRPLGNFWAPYPVQRVIMLWLDFTVARIARQYFEALEDLCQQCQSRHKDRRQG
jgi:hypothetical protein